MGAALLVIQMVHRAECLHVVLDRIASDHIPVEPPGHEVCAIVFFEESFSLYIAAAPGRKQIFKQAAGHDWRSA